jgi:hypothetical protein
LLAEGRVRAVQVEVVSVAEAAFVTPYPTAEKIGEKASSTFILLYMVIVAM